MHHNASAIYKIDDQRLCRSGQNDAGDEQRGTLTDNGRRGEADQTGGRHGLNKTKKNSPEKCSRRRTSGRAKQGGGENRDGQKDVGELTVALDVSISVIRYHPLFAHHIQHLCVALVFMSELITGRCRRLPDH